MCVVLTTAGVDLGFQKGGANRGIYNGWFAKKNDNWLKQLAMCEAHLACGACSI